MHSCRIRFTECIDVFLPLVLKTEYQVVTWTLIMNIMSVFGNCMNLVLVVMLVSRDMWCAVLHVECTCTHAMYMLYIMQYVQCTCCI